MPEQQRQYIISTSHRTLLIDGSASIVDDALAVPISIFSGELSGLQALVRYLHEARLLSFSDIAALLNRSQKTIWTTHHAASKLHFSYEEGGLSIPVAHFASRQFSPLETIVNYLVMLNFSNVDVARLLGLDPRTTWTVKQRIRQKGANA